MIQSGLLGRSILSSRSPWLHEEEARAQGLELTYTLFDFTDQGYADADLARVLYELRDAGFAGVNITYPFKQAVMPLLDELADSARAVGAVNTVAMRDGRLIGHNTDMSGFRDALEAGLPDARLDRVLQLGAGGAGAAVANALLSLGVGELMLSDIDGDRAQALASRLQEQYASSGRVRYCDAALLQADTIDGVVNATPIGMASKPGTPIPLDWLQPRQWVADIVYFPLDTALLQGARARGCAVLAGSGMVIGQAAKAFEIITGHGADVARMRSSFTGPLD
jgi:shikimate dehydrogenase